MSAKHASVALIVLGAALVPEPAWACPVCGLAGPGDNGWAYAAMSVVLSALPLGMIAGTVFWVYKRSHARTEEPVDVPQHQDAVQLRPTSHR
jgi:hypothetical protein